MEIVIYLAALVGSISIGYGLLRTGFPGTQRISTAKKVIYSYAVGLLVFLPAAASTFVFGDRSFFALGAALFFLIFVLMYIKRTVFNEKDYAYLNKEKKRENVPNKVITKEEKEVTREFSKPRQVDEIKIREQVYKEKKLNLLDDLKRTTTEMENKDKEKSKREALEKLRSFARDVEIKQKKEDKKKKDDDEELDELNEEELADLGKGF